MRSTLPLAVKRDDAFEANRDHWTNALRILEAQRAQIAGGGGERAAAEMGVPFLGRIPIDPRIVVSGDSGRPFVVEAEGSEAGRAFKEIVDKIVAGAVS